MAKVVFFGRSDGGQDNLNKTFPCITSKKWTLATYGKISHMNCIFSSRDFFYEQVPRNGTLKPFLKAFSSETPPFSRACNPINLVRSCGSRWRAVISNSKKIKHEKKKLEWPKCVIFSMWFQMIAWSWRHSLELWSCGMCSYRRDPKTQNGVGDYLCADSVWRSRKPE
jgi:hypothetical protein